VAEKVLSETASRTSLKPLAVRVGQLCGGVNGAWNSTEWLPSLVQSAVSLECLPDDERGVSWLPADIAAQALVEFRNAPSTVRIVHLVHPRPVLWSPIANQLSSKLSVPLVPYVEWLSRLVQLDESTKSREVEVLKSVPALRLLGFFKGTATRQSTGLAMGVRLLQETQAIVTSETLADPMRHQLDKEDVGRWLKYWRSVSFLLNA